MKKILSLTLIISIIASLFVSMPLTASASSSISIGDYVQMGEYYGQPILWRCVAFEKVSGYDTRGNPIIDSTDTRTTYADGYLPLMLADRIICLKAFDGKGTNTSGSHGRGYYQSGQQGYYRRNYGSNYWADSNIRDWLNSSASAGNVVWSCGNAPTSANMWDGYNAYNNEAGFLTNFTTSERSAMKTVTQKSLLDAYEYSNSSNNYNSNYHQCNYNISSVVQNYATAYSEQVTDTMFLLDVKQINEVYNNRSTLGNDYYIGTPTAEAVANSEYKNSSYLNSTTKWWSWLRSPYANDDGLSVRYVNSDGGVNDHYCAYIEYGGVRPAFFLNLSSLNLKGDGTSSKPYKIFEDPYKITAPSATELEYGDKLCKSTLTGGSVTYNGTVLEGTFTWKNGEKILEAGEHEETVVFIPKDKSYEEREYTIKVKINKKSINVVFPTFTKTDYVIGTKLSEIEIENTNEYGTFSWENPNQKIVSGDNICKMVFTPNDTENYSNSYKEYIFTNSILPNIINFKTEDSVKVGKPLTAQIQTWFSYNYSTLVSEIKFSKDLELKSITPIDFQYAEQDGKIKEDENYKYLTVIAQHSDNDMADANTIYTPFSLEFELNKYCSLNTVLIEMTDNSVAIGDDEYSLPSANAEITVIPKQAESITISENAEVDGIRSFTATVLPDYTRNKDVLWSIDDEAIATISQDGVLTVLKNGTVTITATTTDGSNLTDSKTIDVKVPNAVENVTISQGTQNGNKIQFTADVLPTTAKNKNIIWSVDDEEIATIDQTGLLTILKNGSITVTATAEDGFGATASKSVSFTLPATLSALSSTVGIWDSDFSEYKYDYTLFVPNGTNSISFNANWASGTTKCNGNIMVKNRDKEVILSSDSQKVTITRIGVTDRDNSTYTINVVRMDALSLSSPYEIFNNNIKLKVDTLICDDKEVYSLYAVGYDNNGKMISVQKVQAKQGKNNTEFSIGDANKISSYKIMALSENLTPLCEYISGIVE